MNKISIYVLFFALIINFPFWINGENSSIGGYDDIHFGIPSIFLKIKSNNNFDKDFAGGIDLRLYPNNSLLNFHNLISFFSSKEILFYYCLIFRILSYYFGVTGWYLIFKKYTKDNLISLVFPVLCVICTPKSYDWMFTSWGPLLIMIPLIILLNNNDLKNYKKALFLFVLMISVSISSFVLYVPIILLLIIYYHKIIYSSLPKFNIWVYVFVIFTFIIYLFQAIELYYSIKVNPFSSRINNYFNLDNFVVENNFFINSITRLKDYLLSNSFILSLLLLCLIASYNSKYFNKLLKNIFFIIILYFFLSAFISIFNFDYLKNYRLDIILNTIGIIILLNLPESLEHVRFSKRNKTIIILISIMILYLFFRFSVYGKLMRLKSEGGFSTCYDYKVLDDLHDRSDNLKNFRICSSPWSPRPSLPIYYDLPTFDGSSASFTKRRSQFWGNGLSNLPQSNIHTHHHTLDIPYDHNYKGIKNTKYKWFEKLNFNFLSMMNVKYVLSHNLLPISNSYNLITSSDKISKLPPLHVYNLNDTWDRIYIPNELILSRFDSSTRDFYDDLKNNFNKNFVYIGYNDFSSSSSEFKNLILNSESSNTNLQYEVIIDSSDNYTIKTSGCGFLVFNYCADKIYFSFENKIIESVPVNGLHTLIYLNDFVDTLQVDFR